VITNEVKLWMYMGLIFYPWMFMSLYLLSVVAHDPLYLPQIHTYKHLPFMDFNKDFQA